MFITELGRWIDGTVAIAEREAAAFGEGADSGDYRPMLGRDRLKR